MTRSEENKKDTLASIAAHFEQNQNEILNDFITFLSIPSISSEPEYKHDVLKCANWVTNYLKDIGFEVEIWETKGHPIIFASHCRAGSDKPTLLIYNHYDVQPIDPIEEWHSPPFTPKQVNEEIFARGAQDNKGQCFYVLQALKLFLQTHDKLPLNIKLCIEGEEEIGSPGLSEIVKKKQKELQADFLAIVDLGLRSPNIPAITLGTRGLVTFDVEIIGGKTDLHSGSHGGIVANPIHALIQLLSTLRDSKGKINIPGFYEDVKEFTNEERNQISFQFDVGEYKKITGSFPVGGELNYTSLERAWIRPTLEINGIQGGYTGKGFKTVIPAKANAKISCRLVPDQDPVEIGNLVAKFLKENAPEGVKVNVEIHPGMGKPVRVSPHARIVKAFSKAFEEVFGMPCEYILEGASIPIIPELRDASKAEVILLGLGLSTDQIHAPNEHFSVNRIKKGTLIMARAFELLSDET